MTAKDNLPDFSDLFLDYIENGVQEALERIDPDPNVPQSDEDRERALYVLIYAVNKPQLSEYTRKLLLLMAPRLERSGYTRDWILVLKKGFELYKKNRDNSTAELALHLGIYYQQAGDYSRAGCLFHTSSEIYCEISNSVLEARSLNREAYVACLQQMYQKAYQHVNKALSLLDRQEKECSASYQVLGELAMAERKFAKAEEFFTESLKGRQVHNDIQSIAYSLRDIGNALLRQNKYVEAANLYEQSIGFLQQTNNLVQLAVVRMNLGVVYLLLKQPHRAVEYFQSAERTLQECQDIHHLAMLFLNKGIAYRDMHEWDSAESAIKSSISYWKEMCNPPNLINAMYELGTTMIRNNRISEGHYVLSDALELLPQIVDDNTKNFHAKNIRFELESLPKMDLLK
ncbi:MAG: tetratricopeptide repeat protein [Chloroflexota bacterium]